MVYMAVKVSFTSSVFDTSRLVNLGILSREYLAHSPWLRSLYEKLAVTRIMEMVLDMSTDAKG